MTAEDLGVLAQAAPGERIAYGTDPLQFGELSVPPGPGPHPVIVNVHGGVWLSEFDLSHSRAQAQALMQAGYAVWNIEYRRIGNSGGGWPGTFLDVSQAADYVRVLAARSNALDLDRVVAMGHSAGGHLALWLAARPRIARESEIRPENPVRFCGVVALAPATSLDRLQAEGVFDRVIDRLLGGSPEEYPDRYAAAMPSRLLPLGLPQKLIAGRHDVPWGQYSSDYLAAARAAADPQVELRTLEDAGHFEVINPASNAWNAVLEAVRELTSRPTSR